MTDKCKPGSFLLPLIAKIRAERIGDDVEQLSDAELLRSMAQGLSRHDDEFSLIACALVGLRTRSERAGRSRKGGRSARRCGPRI
jgi:hypothetical protein